MIKILCGSSEIFKSIEGFTPNDTDYIIIKSSDVPFKHTHPKKDVCHFIWDADNKQVVRDYVTRMPDYFRPVTLVTKFFIEYYELTQVEVLKTIDKFYEGIKKSDYAYYIPLLDYIKQNYDWTFPDETIKQAYQIYLKTKKKV